MNRHVAVVTLQGEGLFHSKGHSEKRKPVLQNILSACLLLYQFINLCCLLESCSKPDQDKKVRVRSMIRTEFKYPSEVQIKRDTREPHSPVFNQSIDEWVDFLDAINVGLNHLDTCYLGFE